MHYILAAVLANLSYALADNGNGLIAKKNSPFKVAIWATIFALGLFLLPLLLFFGDDVARLTPTSVAWVLGTGVLVGLGYLSFIMGMSKGSVTLTGVIGGSFPVVTTLTALLFFGERVSLGQAGAIALILVGVALSSLEGSVRTLIRDIRSSALLFAFGAFFLWGVYFAVVRIPIERVGWFLPQYGANLINLPLFLLIARKAGERQLLRGLPKLPWLVAGVAALQIGGSMLYNYAISQGSTAIVAPIAGSSPAVFAVLAFFIFKEKLKRIQIVGIVAAIAGIVGLSLLSG